MGKTYTQCDIDLGLARSVWNLIDMIEHNSNPPKMIGISLGKDGDTGKFAVGFSRYNPGDEEKDESLIAALSVEPFGDEDDERSEDDDPELRRAMQFMYFYQAVNVTIQKFEMGLL